MKGLKFRVDATSLGLGGALGVVGGSVLGYVLARRALSAKFDARLDAEVEELKAHYNGHLRKLLSSEETGPPHLGAKRSWTDVVKDTLDPMPAPVLRPKDVGYGAGPDHRNGRTEVPGDEISEVPGEDASESLIDVAGDQVTQVNDTTKPYVIGIDELGEWPNPGWQQLTITYYAGDQVLADDKDQPIRDIRGTVGSVELITFGGPSGDPHIKYVRNEKLEIDFEIIYSKEAYADVVLNYGRPDKQRTATGSS